MDQAVAAALGPVVLLIALGALAARVGWIGMQASRDLSNLVFFLLLPALLFRAMAAVDIAHLSLGPVLPFFAAAGLVFSGTLVVRGSTPHAVVLAMSAIYGNVVMIGIPLTALLWGPAGSALLYTLISVHALVLLTTATVVIELAVARRAAVDAPRGALAARVGKAVLRALWHPVPLPIVAGLLFGQTGLPIPAVLDAALKLLGQAFGPVALLLVGVTLAHTPVGSQLGGALALATLKNLVMPLGVLVFGRWFGLEPLALAVMVTAAAMPSGANVFLFAQRYRVAQALSTATVAVSTLLALGTVTAVLAFLERSS